MRYDADKFLKARWRQLHEQPQGMSARDFVGGQAAGDPRPLGQSPRGTFPPFRLGPAPSGVGPFFRREARG